MVLHDVLDELVCGVDGRGFLLRRDKIDHLCSTVSHRKYAVVDASIPGDEWQRFPLPAISVLAKTRAPRVLGVSDDRLSHAD